jgi:hypothetical protein
VPRGGGSEINAPEFGMSSGYPLCDHSLAAGEAAKGERYDLSIL